jgi:nucleoid DNA-binding protein
VTYKEYVKDVAERMNLSQVETRSLIDTCFETVVKALENEERFTIPNLGTFGTKVKEQHRSYSPYYNKFMLLPKKRIVTYYPSTSMKDEYKTKKVAK